MAILLNNVFGMNSITSPSETSRSVFLLLAQLILALIDTDWLLTSISCDWFSCKVATSCPLI